MLDRENLIVGNASAAERMPRLGDVLVWKNVTGQIGVLKREDERQSIRATHLSF